MAEQQLGYTTFNFKCSAGREEGRAAWGAEQGSTREEGDLQLKVVSDTWQPVLLNLWWYSTSWKWEQTIPTSATAPGDLLKHTANVSRPDKNCTAFSTKRLTNKNTLKYISPEQGFFGGFSWFLFSSLLNRLGNRHKYLPAWCWVFLNPSYLYKPVLCFSTTQDLLLSYEERAKCSTAQDIKDSILKPFCSLPSSLNFRPTKTILLGFFSLEGKVELKLADPKPQLAVFRIVCLTEKRRNLWKLNIPRNKG